VRNKATFLALLVVLLRSGLAQPASAGTTTADFLTWERKAQVSFFSTSIAMAAFILVQTKPKSAQCIEAWYFKNKHIQEQRNFEFLAEMPKYKKFHPQAVILGFIEQACGKIK